MNVHTKEQFDLFISQLQETNQTLDFFCDFDKIAHNVEVGSNTVMASQVGVAGSTKVGEWCMFGGQVGLAGHIKVGNKVNLGAQSGVPGSIKDGQNLIGTPPIEMKNYFKSSVLFKKLPDMATELNALKKEVEELKKQLNK